MPAQVLTPHKELIRNILNAGPADRIGIFDLDLQFYVKDSPETSDKFYLFSFDGPFQRMSSEYGLEKALIRFKQEPRHTLSSFKENQRQMIAEYRRLKDKGFEFDGVWMGEDIAYNNGLYFSTEKYREQLLGVHRDISDFFSSERLPLFFHCDGKVEALIPLLVKAKIKAIHPVQELCNPGLLRLKKDFYQELTFIGGVGLHRLEQEEERIFKYIKSLKEGGGYIFSFDGPLPENFDREEYAKLLENIKSEGAYR